MLTQIKLWWAAFKIWVFVTLYVVSVAGTVYYTSQYWINKHKAAALEVQQELNKLKNEAKDTLAKHTLEMETLRNESSTKAANVAPLVTTGTCDELLVDIDRLHDELINTLP